jgi:hypothetical protein
MQSTAACAALRAGAAPGSLSGQLQFDGPVAAATISFDAFAARGCTLLIRACPSISELFLNVCAGTGCANRRPRRQELLRCGAHAAASTCARRTRLAQVSPAPRMGTATATQSITGSATPAHRYKPATMACCASAQWRAHLPPSCSQRHNCSCPTDLGFRTKPSHMIVPHTSPFHMHAQCRHYAICMPYVKLVLLLGEPVMRHEHRYRTRGYQGA